MYGRRLRLGDAQDKRRTALKREPRGGGVGEPSLRQAWWSIRTEDAASKWASVEVATVSAGLARHVPNARAKKSLSGVAPESTDFPTVFHF